METRIDVINHLIRENKYTSYLEIGHGPSFDGVVCENKKSVDPNAKVRGVIRKTSDDFFAQYNDHVDIIFIDGDHSYEQVKRDVTAALKHLNKGGCIVMHDTCPKDETYAGLGWCGDPWKVVSELRNSRKHLEFETYPFRS
jgi:16S rRNA G966 N2-methylase RsmD